MLLQDQIVVTKPTQVKVGVDRLSDEVKRAEVINELVAQWWVPAGADLVLEPWIREGILNEGWKLTRKSGSHVVPDVEGEVTGVNWRRISEDMAGAVRRGEVSEALDMHEVASMQQAMLDEPEEHEHTWPQEITPDSMCEFPGCRLRHDDWSASQ